MTTPAGFDAFGHLVPVARQCEALEFAVGLGNDAYMSDAVVQRAALHVRANQPEDALIMLCSIMDLTGAYRALALLCTPCDGEEPP